MQYKLHIEKFLEALPQTFSIFSEAPALTPTPKVEPISHPPLKLKNLYAEIGEHIEEAIKEEGLSEDSKEMEMLHGFLRTLDDIELVIETQSKKEVSKEQITHEVKNVIKRNLETIVKNYDAR